MKQLLFTILLSLIFNIGYSENNCLEISNIGNLVANLIIDIEDKNNSVDKVRLTQIKDLLELKKDCLEISDLQSIKTTYLALESKSLKSKPIIQSILNKNNLNCINLKKYTYEGVVPPLITNPSDSLKNLIAAYKQIEQKYPTKYGTNHKNNYALFESIEKLMNECTNAQSLLEIEKFNNQIIDEGFGPLTKNFKANLREIINTNKELLSEQLNDNNEENTTKEGNEEEFTKENDDEGNDLLKKMGVGFLIILLLGIGIFLGYKKFKKKDYTDKKDNNNLFKKKEPSTQPNEFYKQNIQGLEKAKKDLVLENNDLKKKIKDKDDKISELNRKVGDLKDQIASMDRLINKKDNKGFSKKDNTPKSTKEILYFASPNAKGEFKTSNGRKDVVPTATMYKFELDNSNNGKFAFYNNPNTFPSTMKNPERLEWACEFTNSYNQEAKRIETITKGTISLEGDMWKVKGKAKIKFVL